MAGHIWFGTDPQLNDTSLSRYNGTVSSGGAFVISEKGAGFNGLYGDNRTTGDGTTTTGGTTANKNLRAVVGGVEKSFLSFCIERNEYIANGGTYYTRISTHANAGGEGGQDGPQGDPLSSRTALLYSQFRQISADGVVPIALFNGLITDGTWDSDDSSALQYAIWKSENESVSVSGLAAQLYNWANGVNHQGSLYNVRVLQLWQNPDFTGHSQDQLTIIPLPPAAWAGLSTLAGVGFVGYIRRRKNSAQ